MRFGFVRQKCFLLISKKGLVKTAKMMYNVINTYYTTLFLNFQEELPLFCKKKNAPIAKTQKGGMKAWKQNFKKRLEKALARLCVI